MESSEEMVQQGSSQRLSDWTSRTGLLGVLRKEHLLFSLRAVLGLSIAGYLIWQVDWTQISSILRGVVPGWLVVALAIQLTGKFLWAFRWQALLRMNGVRIRIAPLVKSIFVGQFFNNFLPTIAGGDLFRAYWAKTESNGYAQSVLIVLIERFLGVVTLFQVAIFPLLDIVLDLGVSISGWGLTLGLVSTILVSSVLLYRMSTIRLIGQSLDWFVTRFPRSILQRLSKAIHRFAEAGEERWTAIIFSIGVQVIGVGFTFSLGQALAIDLNFWQYLAIVPLVSLAAMIPITINGLGLREGAWLTFAAALGINMTSTEAVALGLLSSAFIFGVSLLGGLFYILGKKEYPSGS